MPKIIYISSTGVRHEVDAAPGMNAMQAAVDHAIPGIDADCGGNAACGTCHVYVDEAWIGKTGPAHPGAEQQMLQLADDSRANSRLACQIALCNEFDGLILRMPEGQH
jgi:ferredoxin, 2Fe-2S